VTRNATVFLKAIHNLDTSSFFTIVFTGLTIGHPIAAWHLRCKSVRHQNRLKWGVSKKDALGLPSDWKGESIA